MLDGRFTASYLVLAVAAGLGCSPSPYAPPPPVSHSNHPFFPLGTASHGLDCTGCHADPSTFRAFSCTGCHAGRDAYDLLHGLVPGYAYSSAECYRCHRSPVHRPWSHASATEAC